MALILLVEDNRHQRMLVEEELTDDGHEVLATGSSKEALELFHSRRPQVVIMDILLPGANGLELMEKMLDVDRQVAIIIHSAFTSPQRDFISSFAKAYVLKSSDLSLLVDEVRDAVRASALEKPTHEQSCQQSSCGGPETPALPPDPRPA